MAILCTAVLADASGPSGCTGAPAARQEFMFDGAAEVLVGGISSIEQNSSAPTPEATSKARPSSRRLALAVLN